MIPSFFINFRSLLQGLHDTLLFHWMKFAYDKVKEEYFILLWIVILKYILIRSTFIGYVYSCKIYHLFIHKSLFNLLRSGVHKRRHYISALH